jgi:hypothetical protein
MTDVVTEFFPPESGPLASLTRSVAVLRFSPEELSQRVGIRFQTAHDDLDILDWARVIGLSGKPYALVRHRHAPEPGTQIVVRHDSLDPSADVLDVLNGLQLSERDLTWASPEASSGLAEGPTVISHSGQAVTDKTCFIIFPLGQDEPTARGGSDHVFENVITRALQPLGYRALRSDHVAETGLITDEIIKHLVTDTLVIADLSGHNPSVFYELAIRHAVDKPIIQLLRQGESLPFDLSQQRTIFYDPENVASVNRCIEEITRCIDSIERPSLLRNVVSEMIHAQLMARPRNIVKKATRKKQ